MQRTGREVLTRSNAESMSTTRFDTKTIQKAKPLFEPGGGALYPCKTIRIFHRVNKFTVWAYLASTCEPSVIVYTSRAVGGLRDVEGRREKGEVGGKKGQRMHCWPCAAGGETEASRPRSSGGYIEEARSLPGCGRTRSGRQAQ